MLDINARVLFLLVVYYFLTVYFVSNQITIEVFHITLRPIFMKRALVYHGSNVYFQNNFKRNFDVSNIEI